MRFRTAATASALAAIATTGIINVSQADAQNNTVELVRALLGTCLVARHTGDPPVRS